MLTASLSTLWPTHHSKTHLQSYHLHAYQQEQELYWMLPTFQESSDGYCSRKRRWPSLSWIGYMWCRSMASRRLESSTTALICHSLRCTYALLVKLELLRSERRTRLLITTVRIFIGYANDHQGMCYCMWNPATNGVHSAWDTWRDMVNANVLSASVVCCR